MGVIVAWISQNFGVLLGVLTGGAVISTFRYIREYERGVVTRFGKLVRIKNPPPEYRGDGVREYKGFVFRIPGLWRVQVINIKDRNDQISIDGVERIDSSGRREKWRLQATIKWHVREGYVYSSTQWQVDDIGEFARGKTEAALSDVMVTRLADENLSSLDLFTAAESAMREQLLVHGVNWTDLMIKELARTDAEVQAQSIERAANAIADKLTPRS